MSENLSPLSPSKNLIYSSDSFCLNVGPSKKHKTKRRPHFLGLSPIRTILLFVGLTGFTFQACRLSQAFFARPTFLYLVVQKQERAFLPAVTVCSHLLVKPSSLIQRYGNEHELKSMLSKKFTSSAERDQEIGEWTSNYFETLLFKRRIDLKTLKALSVKEEDVILSCQVILHSRNDEDQKATCRNLTTVLTVFNDKGKCFTYFSNVGRTFNQSLQRMTDNGKVIITHADIEMEVNFTPDINSPNFVVPIEVYVHGPGDLMEKTYPLLLERGYQYNILFWRTITQRHENLEKCMNYEQNTTQTPTSYLDCIDRCIVDTYRSLCECIPLKPSLRTVCNYEQVDTLVCPGTKNNIGFECISERRLDETSSSCQSSCVQSCVEEIFDVDVSSKSKEQENLTSKVVVSRKPRDTFVYDFREQMQFEQYFSNIGSLLGFWLGISVVAAFDQMKRGAWKVKTLWKRLSERKAFILTFGSRVKLKEVEITSKVSNLLHTKKQNWIC